MMENIPVVILCGGRGTRLRRKQNQWPKIRKEGQQLRPLWIYGFYSLASVIRGSLIKEYFLSYEIMCNDCTIQLGKKITYQSNHTEQDFNITLIDTGLQKRAAELSE